MDPRYYGLIELVLTAAGVLAFAWWQLRSLKRDRAITHERDRATTREREAREGMARMARASDDEANRAGKRL